MESESNRPDTYCSAEFKLRKTDSQQMFALVKTGSRALESIHAGDIISITYHFADKTIPARIKATRIKYIEDGSAMGFKDHVMVALDPE